MDDFIIRRSQMFRDNNSCYIHTEKQSGGYFEIHMTGGNNAIVRGISEIISHYCALSGRRFEDVLENIKLHRNLSMNLDDDNSI